MAAGSDDYKSDIYNALQAVTRGGDFCASGSFDRFPLPGLNVPDVGPIALPLLPAQAEALKAKCAPAPYGRKEQTVYDRAVRDTWQLEPAQFGLQNAEWGDFVGEFVPLIKAQLGCEGSDVAISLYKLLLYETGQHFAPHRDTEKEAGMFATLVLSLPAVYTGGELVVRHGDRTQTLDLAAENAFSVCWFLFYADCRHEIKPVLSGHRIALVYNVRFTGNKASMPKPPNNSAEMNKIVEHLNKWLADNDGPERLVHFLAHKYTPESFDFDTLKGKDRWTAQALRRARALTAAPFGVVMALIDRTQSGNALMEWGGGYEPDEDVEVEQGYDVDEGDETDVPDLGRLEDTDEYLREDYFDKAEPDDDSVEEYTGNEGASYRRQYQAAALVLFKRAQPRPVPAAVAKRGKVEPKSEPKPAPAAAAPAPAAAAKRGNAAAKKAAGKKRRK